MLTVGFVSFVVARYDTSIAFVSGESSERLIFTTITIPFVEHQPKSRESSCGLIHQSKGNQDLGGRKRAFTCALAGNWN